MHKPRVMVLDLPPDSAFKPNLLQAIDSLMAKELRDQGFEVVTPADIAAALGAEKQKMLLGCSETSCLAEIGGAMGADYILHGELASAESQIVLTLTLTDQQGRAVNQVGGVINGIKTSELLDAVSKDIPDLVKPLRDKGVLKPPAASVAATPAGSASTPAPLPAGGLQASTAPPPPSEHSNIVGWSLLIGGGVAIAASVAVGVVASGQSNQVKSDVLAGTDPGSLRGSASTMAGVSTALTGAGIVAAGVGGVMLLFFNSSDAAASAAVPGLRGTALAWSF